MTEALSDEWVESLVAASSAADDEQIGDRSGVIELTIGKTRRSVVTMSDGRIVGRADIDPDSLDGDHAVEIDVSIPFTEDQLRSYLTGEVSIAEAYMRGDVKPVGSTGPWLSFVELVESGALRSLG